MKNHRDKKNKVANMIVTTIMMLYFMACGAMLGALLVTVLPEGKVPLMQVILEIIAIMIAFYVCLFVQLCVHEVGHMICGLLSGYQFVSIRFGSLIIYKTEDGIKLGKYSLAGTGGQCIMAPPELPMKEIPTALYNWGGVIANFIMVLIFGALFLISGDNSYIRLLAAIMGMIGLFMVLTNGIPVEFMGNDGYNAIALDRDLKSKQAFVVSFKMISMLQLGLSPKDFPEEWFEWSYEPGDGALASSLGVQKLSWLIMTRQFDKAYALGDYIDKNVMNLALTSQMVVKLETFFSMIMLEKDIEEIREVYKKQQKNLKALQRIPSTQRLLYAYHKLIDDDLDKAKNAKDEFEKLAKKYPYPKEIEAEKELLQLIDDKA